MIACQLPGMGERRAGWHNHNIWLYHVLVIFQIYFFPKQFCCQSDFLSDNLTSLWAVFDCFKLHMARFPNYLLQYSKNHQEAHSSTFQHLYEVDVYWYQITDTSYIQVISNTEKYTWTHFCMLQYLLCLQFSLVLCLQAPAFNFHELRVQVQVPVLCT